MNEPEIIRVAGMAYRLIERRLVTCNSGEGRPFKYTAELVEPVNPGKGRKR